MKKLIALFLIICLASAVLVSCRAGSDRAENNGIVTDDTSKRTDTGDKTTTDRNDGKDTTGMSNGSNTSDRSSGDMSATDTDGNILDDAGDAVSDAVRGATDAVDDILGGGDTRN